MPLTIGDRYAGHYDLFENIFLNYHEQPPSYDVAADGRFVAIRLEDNPPVSVILNWPELLRSRNAEN